MSSTLHILMYAGDLTLTVETKNRTREVRLKARLDVEEIWCGRIYTKYQDNCIYRQGTRMNQNSNL